MNILLRGFAQYQSFIMLNKTIVCIEKQPQGKGKTMIITERRNSSLPKGVGVGGKSQRTDFSWCSQHGVLLFSIIYFRLTTGTEYMLYFEIHRDTITVLLFL